MSNPAQHQDWCVPSRVALTCAYLYNFYGDHSKRGYIAETRFKNITVALAEDIL